MDKQIPFRVVGLQVDNFTLTSNKLQEDSPIEVRTNYEFGVIPEQHLVMARLTYTYLQAKTELLQMTLISTFDVKPEAFKTMLQDTTFTLEPFFSQYLSTINVGAARGEIHARCEQAGSELANVILPPVNLVEALPDPIVISLM
ncbi:hypothetical protein E5358_12625 [Palleniella muris]|uniref:Uncharacterized protein n=1 Tax=Palleniella muris TaxID=3038145 RepID=A0AC61QMA3_9BACT|nr:hypothetical protein E5358_12625 [Palleniella muris]